MRARKLTTLLLLYYAGLAGLTVLILTSFPDLKEHLPIGGSKTLIGQVPGAAEGANALTGGVPRADVDVSNLGESIVYMFASVLAAFLAALPVSWVYMSIRTSEEYDQSLISTVLILPITVTSIVIVVQNSLALAFSLAGIAGAVRFKNSLKSSGDALFILLSVGIGLAAGTGAGELAYIMSFAFSLAFVTLWLTEYGERSGMKRYMSDIDPNDGSGAAAAASAALVPPGEAPAAPPGEPRPPS